MACARCRQDWTLRFSSREDELVYRRTLQPKVLLSALIWQVAALLVHLLSLVAMVLAEAAEEEELDQPSEGALQLKRCFFTLHSAVLGAEALVCLLFAGGVGRRLVKYDWELASAASAACFCASLPWLTPLHFAALWGHAPAALWGVQVQDSESLVLLWLDAMVAWYSLSVPVRSSRLWALLLVVWTSVTLLSSFLSAPCPTCVPVKVLAIGALFTVLGCAAREQERGARERWLSSFREEGSPLSKAVAHGMKEMVEAMCDVVLKLTEDLAVVDAEESHLLFFGRNVAGITLTELMPAEDRERFLSMLSRMPMAEAPECIKTTLLLEAGTLEALLLTVDTGHADARYIVSVSLVRDRSDDVGEDNRMVGSQSYNSGASAARGLTMLQAVSHSRKASLGTAEVLSYAPTRSRSPPPPSAAADDRTTISEARDSLGSCTSLAVPPAVVASAGSGQRSRSCERSMDLPGLIDEAGESEEGHSEVSFGFSSVTQGARTSHAASLSTEDLLSQAGFSMPSKAVNILRSSARNGTAGSLAYSEFSEVSAFNAILPGGRPGGVLSSGDLPILGYRGIGAAMSGDLPPLHRLGGALSGDLPPYPSSFRHRPLGKEAGAQTDPPPPMQDFEVNTPAAWEEVPFVCTRCGKPPKPPGAPTMSLEASRTRGARGLPSRRRQSRSTTGRSRDLPRVPEPQAQTDQQAPSVERADAREVGHTNEFDGSWLVWDDHSGFVSDWLVRLHIVGTRVLDGLGKRTTLTFQDGHAMLEGGRLTLLDGVLYRTGKSGKSLAFVREEEPGHGPEGAEAQQTDYEDEEEEDEAYGDEAASDPSWCGTFVGPPSSWDSDAGHMQPC